MKATSKEDVVYHQYLDGVLQKTEVLKNRAIYKNKAGEERIHYVSGYRTISRENGKAVWHHHCKTVQALNIMDILKKVKETGGAVAILPP